MRTAAIIVAAGRGSRVGGDTPKQWRTLRGRVLVAWSLEVFLQAPDIDRVVLVLHRDDTAMAPGYEGHGNVSVVSGGKDRTASVRAGLESLAGSDVQRVLIHDAARPLVSPALVQRVCDALHGAQGAAPALPVTDALWSGAAGRVSGAVSRDGLYAAQTPQGFEFAAILAAHRDHAGGAADDVEIARGAGIEVVIVPGEAANLKITVEADFARAEMLLEAGLDMRCGNGFDVHRFGDGDRVVLCGISLPHDRALIGHSDADVAMHALTDAIYGAMADGDIGRHFPASDSQWQGADSALFLEHAVARAAARGYVVGNADVTLICETPKIAPFADAMAANLARIIGVDVGRISVKATTTEGLGFAGRAEGIAASASVTMKRA